MRNNTQPWRNGIVKTGLVAVDDLLANPLNWRIHPKPQQDGLQAAIENVGFIKSLLINLRTSDLWPPGERNVETLVDGHARVALAMRVGQEFLPAEYCDLTPDEERIALATLDPLAAMAAADKEKLDALLRDMPAAMDARLQQMLAEMAEREGLYADGEDVQIIAVADMDDIENKKLMMIKVLVSELEHDELRRNLVALLEKYESAKII